MTLPFAKAVEEVLSQILQSTCLEELYNVIDPVKIGEDVEKSALAMIMTDGMDDADVQHFKHICVAASSVLLQAQSQYFMARVQQLACELSNKTPTAMCSADDCQIAETVEDPKISPRSSPRSDAMEVKRGKRQKTCSSSKAEKVNITRKLKSHLTDPLATVGVKSDQEGGNGQKRRLHRKGKLTAAQDPSAAAKPSSSIAIADPYRKFGLYDTAPPKGLSSAVQTVDVAYKTSSELQVKTDSLVAPNTNKSNALGAWRPFKCYVCSMGYKSRDAVYNHFVAKHKVDGLIWNRYDVIEVTEPEAEAMEASE